MFGVGFFALQVVDLGVLIVKIIDEVLSVELAAGVLEEDVGLVIGGVALDVLLEPAGDEAQVALCYVVPHVGLFLKHLVEILCAVGGSHSVGWEVTELFVGPVGILKDADAVVFGSDAEIFLVEIVYGSGKALCG